MNKPLVSIAICTFNGEKFLVEQLDSIINQTYQNLEIVIVDDKSKDETLYIVKGYASKYPNIRIFENETNLGYVKNFEKAIRLCTGDFISLCDQDDIWELNKIEKLLNQIGDAAMAYHDSTLIDQKNKLIGRKISDILKMYEGDSPLPFFFYNCVSGHSILFKRELVEIFMPIPKQYFHDWWIAIVAAEYGGIKYIDLPLVKYRQHIHSSTDILNIKEKKKKGKSSSEIKPDWLATFATKTTHYNKLIADILDCYEHDKLKQRMKLFLILVNNYKLLFALKNKSNTSKINYIRKICFS